jgi:hypothetical protein
MLSLDDNRWNNLTGGYRMKCDPRPLLAQLEREQTRETAWLELWEELNPHSLVKPEPEWDDRLVCIL